MKISFDVIVSSPLKRSVQTAVLVATETGYKSKVRPLVLRGQSTCLGELLGEENGLRAR
jgi:broad specificity phosphatase PhoE